VDTKTAIPVPYIFIESPETIPLTETFSVPTILSVSTPFPQSILIIVFSISVLSTKDIALPEGSVVDSLIFGDIASVEISESKSRNVVTNKFFMSGIISYQVIVNNEYSLKLEKRFLECACFK
jgi:hypothetical protein